MFNQQLVLVAIDQATDVERTMGVALNTALARAADVRVIQVVPHMAVRVDGRSGVWTLEPHGGVDFEKRLASILRSVDQDGVRVQRVTLRGGPELVIPAYAQLHQATSLVVERDFGSPRFWRNGRVVDELARRSPIPVLVLPKRVKHERKESGMRRILTAFDFSIASAVALSTAVDLSRRHGARLTLLHALRCVPQHMVLSGSEAWEVTRRMPAQVEAAADRLRSKAAFFGANDVDVEVATGVAHGAILEFVTRGDVDLVVMGIAYRSWVERLLFGSTLRRVLRRTTVPVLVIPVVAGAHGWPDEPVVEHISRSVRTEPTVDRVAA